MPLQEGTRPRPRPRGRLILLCLAAALVAAAQSPREQLRAARQASPGAPWPRMAGHVVLAWPGSALEQKGYHEPGGGFSPSPGSFGLQIQIFNSDGQIAATSDSLPLNEVRQQLIPVPGAPVPGIETSTRHYRAVWSVAAPQTFQLELQTTPAAEERVFLALTSAGPAGGPIKSVTRRQNLLRVNGRWELALPPDAPNVQIFHSPEDDWGGALFEVPARRRWIVTVTDHAEAGPPPLPPPASALALDLPDARFTASLRAQLAHLLMGLTGNQTRPGDPVNYPLEWLRDGAYSLAALASAGEIAIARRLAPRFAHQDFFGGFGSEADAPGLALWALEEVASRARDHGFDREIWPHAHRKAETILTLLLAREPIRYPYSGPIVPQHRARPDLDLVAGPARDGLIQGRMDHHRPLLFVNAVAWRGLLAASTLARRLNRGSDAQRWEHSAAALREAWWRAFETPRERDNERTLIVGLWPSGIAANDPARYRQALETLWTKTRDPQGGFLKPPLWTYFEIAQAHQWLRLGEPARAWQTLEWFWAHQPSPGLYSWWEGSGEENSFGLWTQIRGWTDPPHVTPHYWTASEMLSLQLAMLAYVEQDGRLRIGSGVPREWLSRPLRVAGLPTPRGVVAWHWDGARLTVTLDGQPAEALPGPAFPPLPPR